MTKLTELKAIKKMQKMGIAQDQAEQAIIDVDVANCELTGRLTDGTVDMGYDEWRASVNVSGTILSIFYYTDQNEELPEDLGQLDWSDARSHYTVD